MGFCSLAGTISPLPEHERGGLKAPPLEEANLRANKSHE